MTWSLNPVLPRRSRIALGNLPRSRPRTKLLERRSGHLSSAGRLRKNSHRSMSAQGRRTVLPASAEPELTRQAVMLTQLRYRDDRDRPPESATPLLYVVQGPRARAIGMEFDLEVVCDQLDVAALVNGRQVRKDGRESPDRFTAAAPVLRCGERSDRGGVEPAAQRHGIVAREAACHRLREQLFEPVSDIGGGEPARLEQR